MLCPSSVCFIFLFFFFQAEDGIRDGRVTGVQTCALPILLNGINLDAGIFMSYIGLYSYYQFDNWAYQPSYVSSNTPWFFNGIRIQIFPSDKLKIEPWI